MPTPTSILPDTTYLERWDCISMLDRPIGSPDGPADAIRQPVLQPDRDVRPFQDVLIELGARLGTAGFRQGRWQPRYPAATRLHGQSRARARASARSPAGAAPTATAVGKGAPNPDQLERYIENDCFWRHHLPAEQLYYKHANRRLSRDAHAMGLIRNTNQIVLQLYVEPLQRFRLAAEGHGPVQPPEQHRARIATLFRSAADLVSADRGHALDQAAFPLHAITQRPMAMYHSWGSQNAWLRQIYDRQPPLHEPPHRRGARHRRRRLGLGRSAAPAA